MSTDDVQPTAPIAADSAAGAAPPASASRDELIVMVTRAHQDSAYGESTLAGRTLAAQSRLPKVIAENLGAGFGQWDFFPEASEIVDFAFAYVPPSTEEELWTLARTWASDDAAARHTLMALVGREILLHELRRIDASINVPQLRDLFEETRPTRIRELRTTLGLDVPPPATPADGKKRKTAAAAAAAAAPAVAKAPRAAPEQKNPTRMPKPVFVAPPKRSSRPLARRFGHPKFGEGVLEREEGEGPDAKLTIKFAGGSKTLLARYVTEILVA